MITNESGRIREQYNVKADDFSVTITVGEDPLLVKEIKDSVTSIERYGNSTPETYYLNQNYPNPFNNMTTIEYGILNKEEVIIRIFNITGQCVKTLIKKTQHSGKYLIKWDGSSDNRLEVPSGIYFCQIKTEIFSNIRKIILIR